MSKTKIQSRIEADVRAILHHGADIAMYRASIAIMRGVSIEVVDAAIAAVGGTPRIPERKTATLEALMHEVERLAGDVATLRASISADHASDPAWSIARMAELAEAHRSDYEAVALAPKVHSVWREHAEVAEARLAALTAALDKTYRAIVVWREDNRCGYDEAIDLLVAIQDRLSALRTPESKP